MNRLVTILFCLWVTMPLAQAASTAQLVFIRGGDVWISNTDGTNQRQVTTVGGVSRPRLANGVLAFLKSNQVYISDSNGTPPVVVPNASGISIFDLSPDGMKLVTIRSMDGNVLLYRMNADGSGTTIINDGRPSSRYMTGAAWGTDGYIYFSTSELRFAYSLFADVRRIPETANSGAVSLIADWSQEPSQGGASGNVIAFKRNPSDTEIWVANTDGTNSRQISNVPTGVRYTTVDQDQDVIYYVAANGTSFDVWSIGIDGSNKLLILSDVDNLPIDFGKIPTVMSTVMTVTKSGTGSGTVTSSPAGINCGNLCSVAFGNGTIVTLYATPDADTTFTGWSGACMGSASCVVTIGASNEVAATFTKSPPPSTFTLAVSEPANRQVAAGGSYILSAGIVPIDYCTSSNPSVFTTPSVQYLPFVARGYASADAIPLSAASLTCYGTNRESRSVTLTVAFPASGADCLFAWAERTYPQLFAPAGGVSATVGPYYYRYFSATANYLATSSDDNHVWVLGANTANALLDVGSIASFLTVAGCSQ